MYLALKMQCEMRINAGQLPIHNILAQHMERGDTGFHVEQEMTVYLRKACFRVRGKTVKNML